MLCEWELRKMKRGGIGGAVGTMLRFCWHRVTACPRPDNIEISTVMQWITIGLSY